MNQSRLNTTSLHLRPSAQSVGNSLLVSLANEAPPAEDGESHLTLQPSLANALATDEAGWALLAPYGDWPHPQGIQRFSRQAADQLVRRFNSLASRIKRAVVGLPIYRGHPDVPAFANTYTDWTRLGHVAGLEARADGLYWRPVLTDEGAALVESGCEYPSIHWTGNFTAPRIFEPAIAKSVGLTPRPNIPSQSLANASPEGAPTPTNPHPTPTPTMPTWLLEILGLPADANEEAVKAKLASLMQPASPEVPAAMANEFAAAKADLEKAHADLAAAQTALANERQATRERLVGDALAACKIAAADKDTWLKRLERDFETESVALANCKPALANERHSERVRPGAVQSDRVAQITSLVSARMAQTKESHDRAYAQVKAANPALFA